MQPAKTFFQQKCHRQRYTHSSIIQKNNFFIETKYHLEHHNDLSPATRAAWDQTLTLLQGQMFSKLEGEVVVSDIHHHHVLGIHHYLTTVVIFRTITYKSFPSKYVRSCNFFSRFCELLLLFVIIRGTNTLAPFKSIFADFSTNILLRRGGIPQSHTERRIQMFISFWENLHSHNRLNDR